MENYTDFATVYDMFMDNVPYEEWCAHLVKCLKEYGINNGIVLELGCGTGMATTILAREGYDMIGIDNSPEMLDVAINNRGDYDILYLEQDMREFELYGTVAAVVSLCDSINYITEKEDLIEVFKLVNNYLDPGGLFIFDVNSYFKYKNVLGDNTYGESRDEAGFIWENYFDEESDINEYSLTLFIKEDDDDLFRKHQEIHYQRGYKLDELKEMIEKSGMEFLGAYDGYSKDEVLDESQRILIICKEKGKAI